MKRDRAGAVLVLGNYRPTLAVARVLKRRGYRVIVSEARHGAAGARYSRFVDALWQHPDLADPDAFAQALAALVAARGDIAAIFPVEENYCAWLARHASRVPEGVPVISPAPDVVTLCLDKSRMLDLARELGVRSLPHEVAASLDELRLAAQGIGYPVIVRPFSHLVRIGDKKAVICLDPEQLAAAFPVWPENQPGLLLQRYLVGGRRDLYFSAREGRIEALLETHVTRTDNIDGTGLSTEGRYAPLTPELADETRRLVEALGYSGIGVTQFVVDARTGEATFLELNPRVAGSHRCAEAIGFRLTEAALSIARSPSEPTPAANFSDYPAGGYYCWLSGDLYGIAEALGRGDLGALSLSRWSGKVLRSALRARVHLTWSLDDPLPALALLARALLRRSSRFPFGRAQRAERTLEERTA